jgi:hypothetical protein
MGDDATPQDGSISLCLACGALSIFQEDLTLRKPTSEEIGEIMADDEMRLMLAKMERARLLTMRDKVVMDGRIRNMPAPPDL